MPTVLKTIYVVHTHPDISLFQTSAVTARFLPSWFIWEKLRTRRLQVTWWETHPFIQHNWCSWIVRTANNAVSCLRRNYLPAFLFILRFPMNIDHPKCSRFKCTVMRLMYVTQGQARSRTSYWRSSNKEIGICPHKNLIYFCRFWQNFRDHQGHGRQVAWM